MSEQLALLEQPVVEPKLTDRQAAVHALLTRAGREGITADEAGATAHGLKKQGAHGPDDRCVYCAQDGKQTLEALKAKGLARYRRARNGTPGAWFPTGATEPEPAPTISEEDEFGY